MAERGPGPHGSAGTPPPRSRPPEAPGGHMVGGSRQPAARGAWSARASERAWSSEEPEEREARGLITAAGPLRTYVSAPWPQEPFLGAFAPILLGVRRPARCKRPEERGERGRLASSPTLVGPRRRCLEVPAEEFPGVIRALHLVAVFPAVSGLGAPPF